MQQLKELGITTIYDLRSETEMHRYETPIPTIEGVEIVHIPVFKTEDYSPEAMAKCVRVHFTLKSDLVDSRGCTGVSNSMPVARPRCASADPKYTAY